jgi:hypothetical protein
MTGAPPAEERYDGPAELLGDGEPVPVEVTLRGLFQPIDGRYHWYGRVARHDEVDELVRSGASVTLRTSYGQATGRLSDRDPWGRYRVAGTGRPPFPVDRPE